MWVYKVNEFIIEGQMVMKREILIKEIKASLSGKVQKRISENIAPIIADRLEESFEITKKR